MLAIGTADEARGLAKGIVVKTRSIFDLTTDMKEQLKTLGTSFQDGGFQDYKEVVDKLYKSIETHLDDVKDLQNAISAYAEILERK